jgi:hypothetical protein
MSLIKLVDNSRTDKNSVHSYLELYDELLESRKFKSKNVLEIGIGPDVNYPFILENNNYLLSNGGSIKLWHDYFVNSNVYALDIINNDKVWEGIKNNERIFIYSSQNAYDENFVKKEFVDKNMKFDFIIDDGPHTLESMINCIKYYSSLLEDDGILIIEDVQSIDWLDILKQLTPIELQKFIKTYDRRNIKNRYDDIVFVIDKSI